MVKKIISIKIDESEKLKLERQSREQGKTMTEIIMEGLHDAAKMYHLEARVKEQERIIQDVQRRYRNATGRRMDMKRKVTIPVTEQEYQAIVSGSQQMGIGKGQFVRRAIIARKEGEDPDEGPSALIEASAVLIPSETASP